MIELAFECGCGAFRVCDMEDSAKGEAAIEFGRQYPGLLCPTSFRPNPTPRMLAIMQNIVDNNGEFVPQNT